MEELDLKQIFMILWNKKIHIVLIMIVFLIVGAIYSFNFVEPRYKAYTTLILAKANRTSEEEIIENNQITSTDITLNSKLISTYSELIKSSTLLQTVISNLKLDISENTLKKSITVTNKADTELIEIDVTNEDAKTATLIANEIAKEFAQQVERIYKINNIYIIDEAKISTTPYNINHIRDILIFGAIGLVISAVYIIIYTLFDTTIKTSEDIENELGLSNLMSIPETKYDVRLENSNMKELVTLNDAKSVVSESFRTLRTNIQFTNKKGKKTLLVTSCFSGEGKSYITSNLAVTFAQAGKRVILVDADMRKGRQGKIFNIDSRKGLSNYLSNLDENGMEINEDISQYIRETDVNNLNVICSGNVPPNPSELLTSDKIQNLITELEKVYDIVIFDGAPILPVADSLILSRLVGSTILVSNYKKTKKDDLSTVKKAIDNVGGRIIGAVINKVPISGNNYNGQYYYYGERNRIKEKKNRLLEFKFFIAQSFNKFKTRKRRLNEKNDIVEIKKPVINEVELNNSNRNIPIENNYIKEKAEVKTDIKIDYIKSTVVKKKRIIKKPVNITTIVNDDSSRNDVPQNIDKVQENDNSIDKNKQSNVVQEKKDVSKDDRVYINDIQIEALKQEVLLETKPKEKKKIVNEVLENENDDETKVEEMSEDFIMENLYPKTKNNKDIY